MELNKIYQGDCLEVLKTLEENSVDSIVTDPPYHLVSIVKRFGKEGSAPAKQGKDGSFARLSGGFMGKTWDGLGEDGIGIANNKEMWAECLRVLKPGGYLLSFGGTRTYHRMAVAIEDAGFEVRDMIEYIYGSGFPKSLNIGKAVDKLQGNEREVVGNSRAGSKERNGFKGDMAIMPFETETIDLDITKGISEWEGWGTALKPAHEPICMARKPLAEKTVAKNVLKYGTGGINIDESRVAHQNEADRLSATPQGKVVRNNFAPGEDIEGTETNRPDTSLGRFPANLIHDNSEEVRECFPDSKGGAFPKAHGSSGFVSPEEKESRLEMNDSGNASRFFKSIPIEEQDEIQEDTTSMEEKLESLNIPTQQQINEHFGNQVTNNKSIIYQAKASKSERNKGCEELEEKAGSGYGNGDFKGGIKTRRSWEFDKQLLGHYIRKCREIREISRKQLSEHFGITLTAIYNWEEKPHLYGIPSRENYNKLKTILEMDNRFDGDMDKTEEYLQIADDLSKKTNHQPRANNHPTVKPIALMEYLIKMVTPKGGVVLDPFTGSGSTLVAAKQNGFGFIGIEMEEDYIKIAQARLDAINPPLF